MDMVHYGTEYFSKSKMQFEQSVKTIYLINPI